MRIYFSYEVSGPGPQSVAFDDVNGDHDLDLVFGGVTTIKIYLDGDTSNDWTDNTHTYSVAWGDADDDGDLDLLASDSETNVIVLFVNQGGSGVNLEHAWSSIPIAADAPYGLDDFADLPVPSPRIQLAATTPYSYYFLPITVKNCGVPIIPKPYSVAWGDFNGDRYLDFAVGGAGLPNSVYCNNRDNTFKRVWYSPHHADTRSVAWGDYDGDGDLDLAISQGGGGSNGVYENTYVMPSHLLIKDFVPTMPLPNNSSYLSVWQPGSTHRAYFFSSDELLSGPGKPMWITCTLFDPDGSQALADSDLLGDPILDTAFEFSLDGGSTWRPATPAVGNPATVLTTTRLGYEAAFLWDAEDDKAISDNARFRVTIVQQNQNGPFQHASISAISPPFRVRGTSCVWPEGPGIIIPKPPVCGAPAKFIAWRDRGDGVTYIWDFGDGEDLAEADGSDVYYTCTLPGTYNVGMTIRGEDCPIRKEVFTTTSVIVQENEEDPCDDDN